MRKSWNPFHLRYITSTRCDLQLHWHTKVGSSSFVGRKYLKRTFRLILYSSYWRQAVVGVSTQYLTTVTLQDKTHNLKSCHDLHNYSNNFISHAKVSNTQRASHQPYATWAKLKLGWSCHWSTTISFYCHVHTAIVILWPLQWVHVPTLSQQTQTPERSFSFVEMVKTKGEAKEKNSFAEDAVTRLHKGFPL